MQKGRGMPDSTTPWPRAPSLSSKTELTVVGELLSTGSPWPLGCLCTVQKTRKKKRNKVFTVNQTVCWITVGSDILTLYLFVNFVFSDAGYKFLQESKNRRYEKEKMLFVTILSNSHTGHKKIGQ